jgi:RNA polymerase-binding transcription factor DksA
VKEYEGLIKKLKLRRIELEKRLAQIQNDLRAPHARDSEEQALEREGEDVLDALDEGANVELDQIIKALARVDNNEYGQCIECGNPIPLQRLEILPYADKCVECAQET